ncbi:DUF3560 domain-containing protein [Nonomuraea sp. NPDC052265]|uniref:DUF3560 domain-containing protein n=1 Tax=Nonomuraea sp. NPDC052265 TaxID=3364374 RepID=UPI0037C7857D
MTHTGNTAQAGPEADDGSNVIRIVHTRAEGTLVENSVKGDGVWPIIRQHGFRFSHNVGLYVPQSQDKAAKRWIIDAAAGALRAAGFTVEVDVDDVTRGRSFAEAEADRNNRAEDRAERYGARADTAIARGERMLEQVREERSHIPLGQPHLLGHYSYNRTVRQEERRNDKEDRGFGEVKRGKYWATRADAAEHQQQHRTNPGTTLRRISKLEAGRRGIVRELEKGWTKEVGQGEEAPEGATLIHDYGNGSGSYRVEPSDAWKARREADIADLDEQIEYWRGIIAEAQARGVKIWSRDDFKDGGFVIVHETAVEVVRANAKSVSIPWAHYWIAKGSPVWTIAQCKKLAHQKMHTDTVSYDEVQGKVTLAELEGLDAAQVRRLIVAKIREARGEPAADIQPA